MLTDTNARPPSAARTSAGPRKMGWRNTAQNLNLNRDYMKADAPEMHALLGLMRKYDPDFYIDLHVTDGMDYQYDITYGFDGWDGLYADSPAIGKWLNDVYRPEGGRRPQGWRAHPRSADLCA
jgi:murein tripeptide amidase MpaA